MGGEQGKELPEGHGEAERLAEAVEVASAEDRATGLEKDDREGGLGCAGHPPEEMSSRKFSPGDTGLRVALDLRARSPG